MIRLPPQSADTVVVVAVVDDTAVDTTAVNTTAVDIFKVNKDHGASGDGVTFYSEPFGSASSPEILRR